MILPLLASSEGQCLLCPMVFMRIQIILSHLETTFPLTMSEGFPELFSNVLYMYNYWKFEVSPKKEF